MDALDRITPPVRPGERLVVRYRLPDGSATDVLGWLESVDGDRVQLRDHSGSRLEVGRRHVLAARRLPPARRGRDPMRTGAEELERVALPGWVADSEPLGRWTLRAGGRFTGRANSCLAVDDPGMAVAEAAQRIVDFAVRRGAHPWAQVIAGSEQEHQLRALGWHDVYVATDVLVTRLADLLGDTQPDPRVQLRQTLEPHWEEAFRRSRPNAADPDVLRRILNNGAPRAFAGVPAHLGLIAIGRGHVSADWLGVGSIWTTPEQRRQGLAGQILLSLGHWAARHGARNVYLQVAADNEPAHGAYERLGFRRHHGYLYLTAPDH